MAFKKCFLNSKSHTLKDKSNSKQITVLMCQLKLSWAFVIEQVLFRYTSQCDYSVSESPQLTTMCP